MYVRPGERVLISGKTGSGKTRGMIWLAHRQSLPVIVLDTKIDPAFETLPGAFVVNGLDCDLSAIYAQHETLPQLIIRPNPHEYNADSLDAFLDYIYSSCENICVCIDELYSLHSNGRPGSGLISLITRGRSKRITVISGAQRPAWISLFCLSETDYYMIYLLQLQIGRAHV